MEPSAETRELTIDEAVAVAILLQKNEQLYDWRPGGSSGETMNGFWRAL